MSSKITYLLLMVLSSFPLLPAQEKSVPPEQELAIARKTGTTVKAVIVLQDQFNLTAWNNS